jgi:hypothetical protein
MFDEAKKFQHDKCSSLFCPAALDKEGKSFFVTILQDEVSTLYAFLLVTLSWKQ